ncbi:serine acetyltransferase [Enterococcus sp. AZ173]|uniref:serine acetyltransferase n=1 Tax=Enterococcus sp. AZ173 TaxID=2774700 RepID=UPI003D296A08
MSIIHKQEYIKDKTELKKWIEADQLNNYHRKINGVELFIRNLLGRNLIDKYFKLLRYEEYHSNNGHKLFEKFYNLRKTKLGIKIGFDIPKNVIAYGVSSPHVGTRIISNNAIIGKNFRIHVGVQIGSKDGHAPIIGNNVYIGPGAKLYGDIYIADNIKIGANSVVTHSFKETGITIAGVPAKKIKEKTQAHSSTSFRLK